VWNSVGLQHPEVDTLVAAAAAQSRGVLSRVELRACGLTDEAIKVRVRSGRLHRVFRGVYAVGHAGLTPEGRWLAAVKACGPVAALSHSSLAMLFELLPVEDRRPEVTIPATSKCHVEGIVVHRTRDFERLSHKSIPTTSAARLILDLAPRLDDVPLRRLMSRAQSRHLTNHRLLARQLDRAAGRPGRARFARVLAGRPPATRTELEDRVHDLLAAAGLTPPHVNVPLRLDGRRVIPDFRWPEHRLIVEADGAQWHDTPQARAEDAERQALLEAHGERVIRVTWQQATAHAARTAQRVALALARSGAEEPPADSSSRAQRTTGTT
jgi:very-short-patch-repair endonuclease